MLTRDDPSGTPGAVREIFSSSGFFPLQEILLDRFASLRDRIVVDHHGPSTLGSKDLFMSC